MGRKHIFDIVLSNTDKCKICLNNIEYMNEIFTIVLVT